jgi:hypothetical protein
VFSNTYHGSYKDTVSRVRFFESHDVDYRQIVLDRDDPEPVLDAVSNVAEPRFLLEYTSFRRTLAGVRRRFPDSFIAVRSHNIEPLQHWDNAEHRFRVHFAKASLNLFRADWVCKRHASAIYSISDWENRVYWDRLPGKAAVEWLPYHCPEHLRPLIDQQAPHRRRIVCLPTSQKNRKSWDLVTRFIRLSERLDAQAPGAFEFLLTGNLSGWSLPDSPVVVQTGLVDDLRELMSSSLAVCLLSPLGYGFKTTIGDAIAHGCRVLAHPRLKRRCPDLIQKAVFAVDTNRMGSVHSLQDILQADSNESELDEVLKRRNHQILSRDFGVVERPQVASTTEASVPCAKSNLTGF